MKKQSTRTLVVSIVATVCMIVAIVGMLFLPFYEVEAKGFSSYTVKGVDYIEFLVEDIDQIDALEYPGIMIYIAYLMAILALIAALITIGARKIGAYIPTMILAIAAMSCMGVFTSEYMMDTCDLASMITGIDTELSCGSGFILFMTGAGWCFIAALLGIIFAALDGKRRPAINTMIYTEVPEVLNGCKCTGCGNPMEQGVAFCRMCGAPAKIEMPQVENASVMVEPKETVDMPVTRTCSCCNTVLTEGMKFCRVCGAAQEETPIPDAPVAKGKTCSKCGAALMEGAKFCSICASPVGAKPVYERVVQPERKICCKCGATLQPGAKFCVVCAAPVELVGGGLGGIPKSERRAICPKCGARQSEENRFCRYCNTPLQV